MTLARDPVIFCGHRSTRVEYFHAAVMLYGMLLMWLGDEWLAGRLAPRFGPDGESGLFSENVIPSASIGHLFVGRWFYLQNGTLLSLYDLLHTAYSWSGGPGLGCGNSRDKIYGLLGIASDAAELGIVPDYSKTAKEVFEEAARALIAGKGIVDVLKWCSAREGRPPSWVPDWNFSVAYSRSDDVGVPLFRASGSRTHPTTTSPDLTTPGTIHLRGCCFGTVVAVGSLFTSHAHKSFSYAAAKTMFSELEGFLFRRKEPSVYT
jgi:hypothetical protein